MLVALGKSSGFRITKLTASCKADIYPCNGGPGRVLVVEVVVVTVVVMLFLKIRNIHAHVLMCVTLVVIPHADLLNPSQTGPGPTSPFKIYVSIHALVFFHPYSEVGETILPRPDFGDSDMDEVTRFTFTIQLK